MTRRTTTRSLAAVAMAVSLLLTQGALAEVTVGVVDMQRALNECKGGKRAKEEVRKKFESAQRELRRQREDLDKRRTDYDKKLFVLKDEERRNLEKDLEKRNLDFKRRYEDFQRDLKRTDAELTAGIVEELYEIVNGYAQERGFTFVLETSSGALVYVNSSIDITDEIIKRHDKR